MTSATFPSATFSRVRVSSCTGTAAPARPCRALARRAAAGWLRRLALLAALACLAVTAFAAPICEMACALDRGHASMSAHMRASHGAGKHQDSPAQHDSADRLHPGACHLSVVAALPLIGCEPGPLHPGMPRASRYRTVIASLNWPPPERPPRLGSSF